MNLAVSCGTASVFASGCFDISACARAPETISALIAAEIISVLSVLWPPIVFVPSRKGSLPCPGTTREHSHAFRAVGTWHAPLRRGFAHCKLVGRRRIEA